MSNTFVGQSELSTSSSGICSCGNSSIKLKITDNSGKKTDEEIIKLCTSPAMFNNYLVPLPKDQLTFKGNCAYLNNIYIGEKANDPQPLIPKIVKHENLIFDPNAYSEQISYTLNPKRSLMKKLVIGIFIGLVISGIGFGGYKVCQYSCQQDEQSQANKQNEWKSIPQEYKDAICASERYEHFFTIILNEHPEKFSNISMDQLNDIWDQVPHGNSSDDDEWLKKELVKHLDFSSQQVATNK